MLRIPTVSPFGGWHIHTIVAVGAFCGGFLVNEWRKDAVIAELKLDIANKAEILRLSAQHKITKIDITHAANTTSRRVERKKLEAKLEDIPANAMLSGSLRLLHDAAATGKVDTAGATDAAPVAVRTLARTLADNYTAARINRDTLEALQEVVRASGCFDLP